VLIEKVEALLSLRTALAFFGPLLTAGGATLLAYDILRGPVRWYDEHFFFRGAKAALLQMRDSTLKKYEELRHLYPSAEYDKLVDTTVATYSKLIEAEEARFTEKGLSERSWSVQLAVWGLGLVVIGSLMQSVSALLS
jgi:hypothetical protein